MVISVTQEKGLICCFHSIAFTDQVRDTFRNLHAPCWPRVILPFVPTWTSPSLWLGLLNYWLVSLPWLQWILQGYLPHIFPLISKPLLPMISDELRKPVVSTEAPDLSLPQDRLVHFPSSSFLASANTRTNCFKS